MTLAVRSARPPRAAAPVREILERALAGERIPDADAVTLLRSRELVAVGRAADELRARPGRLFTNTSPPDAHE